VTVWGSSIEGDSVVADSFSGGGFRRFILCFNRPCRSIKSFRTKDMLQIVQVNGFSPVSKISLVGFKED
jgi:hypothetical protein